jgi:phosphatidylinositol phospholipase C beta
LFVADFMAALSDPRAFLGAREKQTDQMKKMGIEETDSKTVRVVSTFLIIVKFNRIKS